MAPLDDFAGNEVYDSEVERILAGYFDRPFRAATRTEDLWEGTDYVADGNAEAPSIRVAARLRAMKYFDIYPCSLLIRSGRPRSGRKTELQKILGGEGDFYIYGFRDSRGAVPAWVLFDLNRARQHSHFRYVMHAQRTMTPRPDSECKDLPLFVHDGKELFPGAIVASHGMFWGDPTRGGRPLTSDQVIALAPATAHWNVPKN